MNARTLFRTFGASMLAHPERWMWAVLAAVLILPVLDGRNLIKAQFGVAQREDAKYRALLDQHAKVLEGQLAAVRADANQQLKDGRRDFLAEVRAFRETADRRAGDTLDAANGAIKTAGKAVAALNGAVDDIHQIRAGAVTALDATAKLAARYTALPGDVAATLRPAWQAAEPEITCKDAQGRSYSGCIHSRVTGLMGEALRVAGIFASKFPALADSFTEMAADARGFFDKYVQPHPTTPLGYVKAFFKFLGALVLAALRGGAI